MEAITYTLAELAEKLQVKYQGDPDCQITGIGPLESAKSGQISFLNNSRYRKYLASTQASVVILKDEDVKDCPVNALIVSDPHWGYAKVAELFEYRPSKAQGIHPSAIVGKHCKIHPTAAIGAHCVLGDYVEVGENSRLDAGCVVGEYTTIGQNSHCWARVTIYHHVTIQSRVIIHSGAVIGSDGFGNVRDVTGAWHKIPQLGGVIIHNDVEIGANTTIDRGSLKDTIIEEGVKLDNLIQIAHNVFIGKHTVIAACTGVAGSTHIGSYCMIGGGSRIADNIEIADYVILLGAATVPQSIKEAGVYGSGTPLQPYKELIKNTIRFRELDSIARRLKQLEKMKDE